MGHTPNLIREICCLYAVSENCTCCLLVSPMSTSSILFHTI